LMKRSSLRKKRYFEHKEKARTFVHERLCSINEHYGFKYRRVSIRDTKTRWGSCSSQGNLNFSYKIIFLPPYLADYVITHELCHLQEFNHSKHFWNLVEQKIPDHHKCKEDLHLEAIRLRN